MFPSHGCDRVIILNLFAADLVPRRSLRVETERVEAVKIANDDSFARGIELGTRELFHAFVL